MAFINESLVLKYKLPVRPLSQPRRIRLADGDDGSGSVTHNAYSWMNIGSHYELLFFLVTKLGSDIILGYPWLQKHNPVLDFSANTIFFRSTHCLNHCLQSGMPEMLQGMIEAMPLAPDHLPYELPVYCKRPAHCKQPAYYEQAALLRIWIQSVRARL